MLGLNDTQPSLRLPDPLVTQGKGNQGIFTQGKVTQSNIIHTITQGKITLSRVTWDKFIITQGKDKVTQVKFNLGRY